MEYGILYFLFSRLIKIFCKLNLVERFKGIGKYLALYFHGNKTNKEFYVDKFEDASVDIFIILKWLVICLFWFFQVSNLIACIITWYLILTNIFTYFYYHIWHESSMYSDEIKIDKARRRFAFLIYALSFSIFSFSYLYSTPYKYEFTGLLGNNFIPSILYSISVTFIANYEDVKPIHEFAWVISTIQLVISIIFLAIILTKSIPQTKLTK